MNWKTVSVCGVAGCLAVMAAPAHADDGLRPDTLQSLGVGARATGLGGAFVALADDTTATFWNPAGLGRFSQAQLALDFRTLPKSNVGGAGGIFTRDVGATDPQFSYFGVAFPVGGRGALGFSRTLGGFEQVGNNVNGPGLNIARYWYNTLAYGRNIPRVSGLQMGVALQWAELRSLIAGGGTSVNDSAEGIGFDVGALYTPPSLNRLTVGANYLSPVSTSGLGAAGPTFGTRIPGRISGGASYLISQTQNRRIVGTVEVRESFGADKGAGVIERRNDTTNFHVGGEYRFRTKGENWLSARAGFYTRNSSNSGIFYDDRVATVGFGYEHANRYRADVAAEISTVTGDPTVVMSMRYNVGRAFTGPQRNQGATSAPGSNARPGAKTDGRNDSDLRQELERLKQRVNELEQKQNAPGAPANPAK